MLVELGVVAALRRGEGSASDGRGTVTEVADRYASPGHSLHNWLRRYRERGVAGQGPWRNPDKVEFATHEYIDWFNFRGCTERSAMSRRQSSRRCSFEDRGAKSKPESLYRTQGGSLGGVAARVAWSALGCSFSRPTSRHPPGPPVNRGPGGKEPASKERAPPVSWTPNIWPPYTRAVATCPNCGTENPEHAKFCLECATPLHSARPAAAVEERKVVTVLFCDLVGFTAASDSADPEDVRATLRPYHALLKQQIEHFGGTVEKFVGDAVMAVYGAPVAHEDDAERAIRSGLRILEAIDDLNTSEGLALSVRIGINTGEAVVSLGARPQEGEGFVTGDVVNTASRLQGVAPTNGIVVGETTYRTTKYLFEYEELEPVRLKGKAKPVPIWRPKAARSRFGVDVDLEPGTPFIGRELERALLQGIYARALKESSVQLVTVTGEPGVGKSRLIRELSSFVEEQEELVSWRQGRCLPYGEGITFWALGEIVKAQAGILESDGPDAAADKLEVAIEAVLDEPAERAWLKARLAPLVGLMIGDASVASERAESFTDWRRFLEGIAAQGPLVLIVEDLHWADDAMLEFLDHLLEWASGVPMLVVCSARPELHERHPEWGGGTRNATTIGLDPLGDEDTAKLVASLLSRSVLPAKTQALLLARAGGNPLYAEEFVRMLRDRGMLKESGRVVPLAEDPDTFLPETVQALIAARLDTLSPKHKALLQDAAVVGKVFWSGALAAMGDRDERSVKEGLHELVKKELLRQSRTSSVADQDEHVFWHVLVKDVAYSQIPRGARGTKHEAAAAWMERMATERLTDVADVLAYHYIQARELALSAGDRERAAGLADPARRFLVMAGDRAMALDPAAAEQSYRDALELTEPGQAKRPGILARWGRALTLRARYPEAASALEDAIAAYEERGDPRAAAATLAHHARVLRRMGNPESVGSLLRAMRLLEPLPPGAEFVEVYTEAAHGSYVDGDPSDTVAWAEKAIAVAAALGLPEPAEAVGYRGGARCLLGDEGGVPDIRRALEVALTQGLAEAAATLYNTLAYALWGIEGPRAALDVYREGLSFAERTGVEEQALTFAVSSLDHLVETGAFDEVLTLASDLARRAEEAGSVYDLMLVRWNQIRVLARRGRFVETVPHAAWLVETARATGSVEDFAGGFPAAALAQFGGGHKDEARALLRELDAVPLVGKETSYASGLADMVRIALAAGDEDLADRLAAAVQQVTPYHAHALRTAQALLAEHRGDHKAAADLFRDAAERWESFGVVWECAQALLGLGRCLLALSSPDAEVHLREAREVFVRLKAGPLIERTDDSSPARPPRAPSAISSPCINMPW